MLDKEKMTRPEPCTALKRYPAPRLRMIHQSLGKTLPSMKMGNWNRSFTVVQECKIDGNTAANNIVATLTSANKTDADPARNAAKKG